MTKIINILRKLRNDTLLNNIFSMWVTDTLHLVLHNYFIKASQMTCGTAIHIVFRCVVLLIN